MIPGLDDVGGSNARKIICLTPIRNEARNLRRFLSCASIWADAIVLLDQHSEDDSKRIAEQFPKVVWRENRSIDYDEESRQLQLIAAARELGPSAVMIALDADEVLTANCLQSKEWLTIRQLLPGAVFFIQRINFLAGFERAWLDNEGGYFPVGFVDDGSMHRGKAIHSHRVPVAADCEKVFLGEIKCLHYQYADWAAMRSKHRWYQCWEVINRPARSATEIFRQYHHMIGMPSGAFIPFNTLWIEGYLERDIDMTTVHNSGLFWWDLAVIEMMLKHGAQRFRKLAVWDQPWHRFSESLGFNARAINDPRGLLDKIIQRWLWWSQPFRAKQVVKRIDKKLDSFGY